MAEQTHGADTSTARFLQIDGLRGWAILLVVAHHAFAATWGRELIRSGHAVLGEALLRGTASGVELFFVISGVVLLRPYLRDGRALRLFSYFKRRGLRLWPPFFVAWLISGLAVYVAQMHPTWWTQGAALTGFSPAHWLQQLGIIYWGKHSFNFAWWSLNIECLFYLLVPLLVLAIQRCKPPVWMVLVILTGLAVGAEVTHTQYPWLVLPAIFRLFLTYGIAFAFGLILARYDVPRAVARLSLLAGAGWCVAAFIEPSINVHTGFAMLYGGLIALSFVNFRLQQALASWHLVWLGERSYSLFLTHYAVFTLVCHAVSAVTASKGTVYLLLTRAIELPAALLVAMCVFSWVERRFARNLSTADCFWPRRGRIVREKSVVPPVLLAGR